MTDGGRIPNKYFISSGSGRGSSHFPGLRDKREKNSFVQSRGFYFFPFAKEKGLEIAGVDSSALSC